MKRINLKSIARACAPVCALGATLAFAAPALAAPAVYETTATPVSVVQQAASQQSPVLLANTQTWGDCFYDLDTDGGTLTLLGGTLSTVPLRTVLGSSNADKVKRIRVAEGATVTLPEGIGTQYFAGLKNLKSIESVGAWDVSAVTDMHAMFRCDENLQDISGLRGWDVSSVENMALMFQDCKSLEDLTPLTDWRVFAVTNFSYMFERCTSLEKLDGLEYWDVRSDSEVEDMFAGCNTLENTSATENWGNIPIF